jgi:hypothetical protein
MFGIDETRELENARIARKDGMEGRARVCARRAAGAAFAKLLSDNYQVPGVSMMNALSLACENGRFPLEVQNAARRLTLSVDANHELPEKIDLIAEAETIIHFVHNLLADVNEP